jgi:hypothetical protein
VQGSCKGGYSIRLPCTIQHDFGTLVGYPGRCRAEGLVVVPLAADSATMMLRALLDGPAHSCTLLHAFACAIGDILRHWRQSVRGKFKPTAFDPHFEDGRLVAFLLFAVRRLIRLWIV